MVGAGDKTGKNICRTHHFVALAPMRNPRLPRRESAGSDVSILTNLNEGDYWEIGPRYRVIVSKAWITASATLVANCFMYGLAAYCMIRYCYNVVRIRDNLTTVDQYLVRRFGRDSGVDNEFFGSFGTITLVLEFYTILLTFFFLSRQYNEFYGFNRTNAPVSSVFTRGLQLATCLASLLLAVIFFFYSDYYHNLVITKVFSLSPNGDVALELFKNLTSTPTLFDEGLFGPAFPLFN